MSDFTQIKDEDIKKGLLDSVSSNEPELGLDDIVQIQNQTKRNIWLMYTTALLVYLSSATLIPSLWPYLESLGGNDVYLGLCVSAFSFGQILGAPILGYWSNHRGPKKVLLVALCIMITGDLIYSMVPNRHVLLVSRIISGFACGLQAVAQAYISLVTTTAERTNKLANFNFASSLSFIVGPAIAFILAFVYFDVLWFSVDSYTAPGFFSAFVAVINVILIWRFFKDHTSQELKFLRGSQSEKEQLLADRKSLKDEFFFSAMRSCLSISSSFIDFF